jgi:hypothetical protein
MGVGLQVWDAAGNLVVDTTTRVGKILGVTTLTGGVAGSVVDSRFGFGVGFWRVVPLTNYAVAMPTLSLSGDTLSWTWPNGGSGSQGYSLVYGVY